MTETIPALIKRASTAHPRLFVDSARIEALKAIVGEDSLRGKTADFIIASAREILDLPVLEREMEGRRLLEVSRVCLKQIQFLGMAYHLTGEDVFARKAESQLLAVCAFSDWNPSHMLDVAEMCAAVAIGYDWLYHALEPDALDTIKDGLLKHGIDVLAQDGWWVTAHNNWNQVCHCGAVMAVLAVHEHLPEVCAEFVERAVNCLPNSMREYAPDGGYPEGPMYWDYGTSFNVMLIEALDSVLGTDLGVSEATGFIASAGYQRQATGPSGHCFNYADCHQGGGLRSSLFWFAQHGADPSVLYGQVDHLARLVGAEPRGAGSSLRVFPIIMTWLEGVSSEPQAPAVLHKRFEGTTPVGFHRSGWGKSDTFAGLKAGSPQAPHGHMDAGTFVIDRYGVRWAEDLGAENYYKIERRGINLWTSEQDGDRWTIFRLNNFSHNTLTVNEQLHRADSHAPIIKFSDGADFGFTQIDFSSALAGHVASAKRGLGVTAAGDVIIRDEVQAADSPADVRWAMMTKASAELLSPTQVKLSLQGHVLLMSVVGDMSFSICDRSQPVNEWDSPNNDLSMISLDYTLNANESKAYSVCLHGDGSAVPDAPFSLDAW